MNFSKSRYFIIILMALYLSLFFIFQIPALFYTDMSNDKAIFINILNNVFYEGTTYESFLEWPHILVHLSYIYFIKAPALLLPFSPLFIYFIFEAVFYIIGVLLVYKIFNALIKSKTYANILCFIYLLHPVFFLRMMIDSLDKLMLFIFPVFIYFFIKQKYMKMFLTALLIIFLKEEFGFYIAAFYLIYSLKIKKIRDYALICCVAVFILYLFYINSDFYQFAFFTKSFSLLNIFNALLNYKIEILFLFAVSGGALFFNFKLLPVAAVFLLFYLNLNHPLIFYPQTRYLKFVAVLSFFSLLFLTVKNQYKEAKFKPFIIVSAVSLCIALIIYKDIYTENFSVFFKEDFKNVALAKKNIENIKIKDSVLSSLTFQSVLAARHNIKMPHIKNIESDYIVLNLNDPYFVFSYIQDKDKLKDLFFCRLINLIKNNKYGVYYYDFPVLILKKYEKTNNKTNSVIEKLKSMIKNESVLYVNDADFKPEFQEINLKFYFYSKYDGKLEIISGCQKEKLNVFKFDFMENQNLNSVSTDKNIIFKFKSADGRYETEEEADIALFFKHRLPDKWYSDKIYFSIGDIPYGLYKIYFQEFLRGEVDLYFDGIKLK